MGHDAVISAADDLPLPGPQVCAACGRAPLKPLPTAPRLTPRQFQVLSMISVGLSNSLISRRLKISKSAVKWHLEKALALLNATNRAEAASIAIRLGLI